MKRYHVGNKTIFLDLDDDVKNAASIPSNNLRIYEDGNLVWELDEVAKGDACVGLNIGDEQDIEFTSFNGLRRTLNLKTLTITKTQITK